VLDGRTSLVVSFRGSDDSIDSQHDLTGINQDYRLFASLVAAVDAAAASGVYQQVVVTGHSLGGAMAQLYMAEHPDQPGGVAHDAVTFGSLGAVLPPGEDARAENYVIADDPAVVLGAHRAEVGAALRADDQLAEAAADRAAQVFPGLTKEQALASLGTLTVDYENHGDIILLPGATGQLSPEANLAGLAALDPMRHTPELYTQELALAAAGGPTLTLPTGPQDDLGLAFLREVYDSDQPDTGDALASLLSRFVDDQAMVLGQDTLAGLNDASTTLRDGLAGIAHDFSLI
jgi:pimeloyl-ACP methyl ester carboxylesterase